MYHCANASGKTALPDFIRCGESNTVTLRNEVREPFNAAIKLLHDSREIQTTPFRRGYRTKPIFKVASPWRRTVTGPAMPAVLKRKPKTESKSAEIVWRWPYPPGSAEE